MPLSTPPAPPAPSRAELAGWMMPVALAMLVAAGCAAYSDSFHGPLIYDDLASIQDNPSIRHWWPPAVPLSPPHGRGWTVEGRPILNASLAFNYALSGTRVGTYHLVNLVIHLGAGLALWGVIRRTLIHTGAADAIGAWAVAGTVALLWLLHPLQTEAVTYVIQRGESLMGLFFLLTLYGFIRSVGSRSAGWAVLSVGACLLGMGTKEVMVMAPVLVLLYDRTFAAGSILAAIRRRPVYYACLAATWIWLGVLVWAGGGNRSGSAGFGSGLSWGAYELTQFEALVRYLGLSLWPRPLAFDYGPILRTPAQAAPYAVLIVGLFGASLWAFFQPAAGPGRLGSRAFGLAGAWFFLILAVTSLTPGGSEMIVERRMYLPLAAVIVVVVWAGFARFGGRALVAFGCVAVVLGVLTWRRNQDYRSDWRIWSDSLAKYPHNARAEYNLGVAYFNRGDRANEAAHYQAALELDPNNAEAHHSLANAQFKAGHFAEALREFAAAEALKPADPGLHYDFGTVLLQSGDLDHAAVEFKAAIGLRAAYPQAHDNLGTVYARRGRMRDAIAEYRAALALAPNAFGTPFNLANALCESGQFAEALPFFVQAAQADPENPAIQRNFGMALVQSGHPSEAIAHFEAVLRRFPDDANTRHNLAVAQAAAQK